MKTSRGWPRRPERAWRPTVRPAALLAVLIGAASFTGCYSDNAASSTTLSTPTDSSPSSDPSPSPDSSPSSAAVTPASVAGTTGGTDPGFTIPPPPTTAAPWEVDTANCAEGAAADAEITGTLTIGTVAPQSGGLISVIYAPVLAGFQAYVDDANGRQLLGDVELKVVVADDQGKPELTPFAVGGLLEADAAVVSALPGSANNLAVRDSLNDKCVPQLMSLASTPRLGDVHNYPWTMGGVVTDILETTVYANAIERTLGEDATVGVLVSNDEAGAGYATAFATAASDSGLVVVEQQSVEPNVIDAPIAQVGAIVSKVPQAIVASLSGAACATFLTELDRVRTALPGLDPVVYLSGDCADASILRLAGAAADGVLSSANLVFDDPDFVERMSDRGLTDGYGRAAEGWTAAEVTVEILIRAQRSAAGLTRAAIIDAARNLSYVPSLARPGVEYTTNGDADAFAVESLQVVRYDAATRTFDDVGSLVAQFES